MKLVINYSIFALIATAANIGAQEICIQVYRGAADVMVSVMVGTGVGLVVKYVLDKKYIFCFETRSAAHERATFFLYATVGLVTTVIFWGTEFLFHWWFQSKEMRYFGGVIGLGVGYLLKYQFDKRFVFRDRRV